MKRTDRLKEEKAILALEAAYDLAWNRGDTKALVKSFASDAIVINPYGEAVIGKAAFKKAIAELLNDSFRGSTHKTRIVRIHLPRKDIAVVDGEATLTGIRAHARSTALTHQFTDIMVKEKDRWLVAGVRAYTHLPRTPSEVRRAFSHSTIQQHGAYASLTRRSQRKLESDKEYHAP